MCVYIYVCVNATVRHKGEIRACWHRLKRHTVTIGRAGNPREWHTDAQLAPTESHCGDAISWMSTPQQPS